MTAIERWRIRNVARGPLIAEPVGFGEHHHRPVLGSGFEVVPSDAYQGAVARITELEAENARLRRDRLELENMEIARLREGSR